MTAIRGPQDFGRMIKDRREALALSRAELERIAGLHEGQARRLETSILHIDDIDLASVLSALGLRSTLQVKPLLAGDRRQAA